MPRLSEFYGIVIQLHVGELVENWNLAQQPAAMSAIEPLQ